MSEAKKAAPSDTPKRRGETRRAPTTSSGSSAWTTATEKAPRTRPRAARTAAARPGVGEGGQGRLDEVDQDLGVGLRREDMTGGGELVGQLDVVLDDPVVDEGQTTRAVEVGVGVALGRTAVGGPPGVADTGGGGVRRLFGPLDQVVERTGPVGGPGPPQPVALTGSDQGDAGRVVPPVLEAGQTLEEDLEDGGLVTLLVGAHRPVGDPDNAAHGARG